jgi:ATP-dependent DNA ligase
MVISIASLLSWVPGREQPHQGTQRGAAIEHMEGDGETVFRHACKLGLEGIVSKRKDSAYRSGRSPDWLKMKNADASAVKREEEEEWGRRK